MSLKIVQNWLQKRQKKKEAGMAVVVDAIPSTPDSANVVQDSKWAFPMQCNFDSLLNDSCMSIVDLDVWYFDSGATKHITLQ